MLAAACQMFLGKTEAEIAHIALETLEGHQRAIMAHMTVEVGLRQERSWKWGESNKAWYLPCTHPQPGFDSWHHLWSPDRVRSKPRAQPDVAQKETKRDEKRCQTEGWSRAKLDLVAEFLHLS